MLSLQGYLSLINDRGYKEPQYIRNWRRIYYGMSLHIDGICPAYRSLRFENNRWNLNNDMVTPLGYGGLEYQLLFEDYLFSKHPHEPEITRQWRLSQYKPFTREPFLKAMQVITGAIFQDSGYTIQCSNQADNDYIWGNNFDNKNFVQYLISTFQNICQDPNGVYVVIPDRSAKETDGEVRPQIHFVKSRFIKYHTEDEIIFQKDELIWVANRFGYFRFQKVEQSEEWRNMDDGNGYYVHMLGYKPIVTAGGIWNAQGYYDSWLQAAKPIADEYVGGMSGEQLVMKEASHPFITVAESNCPECNGAGSEQVACSCGGSCNVCEGLPINKSCNTCHGTGSMSHNPADWQVVPADQMGNDLIKITNPNTEINKLHIDRNAAMKQAIMQALHLDVIDQAQSGTAKAMDMETRYQFLSLINNDLFDRIIPRLLDAIISLRNVTVTVDGLRPVTAEYTLVKPTQFQIKTSYDLLVDFTEASKDLPDFMRGEYLIDLADKQFGGDEALKRKTVLITQMDSLFLKKDGDIQIIAVNNWKSDRDIQFHYELSGILDTIIRTWGDDRFLKAKYDEIKAEVDRLFAEIKPPVTAIQPIEIDENRV